MPYKGCEKGEDGLPVVHEKEASAVRLICRWFLDGKTPAGSCRQPEDKSIPAPSGKQKWSQTTASNILRNGKYKGDALPQRKCTVDILARKRKTNEGEAPPYGVSGSQPAVVCPAECDRVQAEMIRRKVPGRSHSGCSVFSTKLIRAGCGGHYGQKAWHYSDDRCTAG